MTVEIPCVSIRTHCIHMVHDILDALAQHPRLSYKQLTHAVGTTDWILHNCLQMLCLHGMVGRSSTRSYKNAKFWRLSDTPHLDVDSDNIVALMDTYPDQKFGLFDLLPRLHWTFDDEDIGTRKRKIAWRCLILCAYNKLAMDEHNSHRVYFHKANTIHQ